MKIAILMAALLINISWAAVPGDLDCNNRVDISDAVKIINYIFGGPEPKDCIPKADSTIILYWTMPPDVDVNFYQIRWSFDSLELVAWDSANIVNITDSTPMYPSQNKLLPIWGIRDSVYYFGIKTKDIDNNWSETSNILKLEYK